MRITASIPASRSTDAEHRVERCFDAWAAPKIFGRPKALNGVPSDDDE